MRVMVVAAREPASGDTARERGAPLREDPAPSPVRCEEGRRAGVNAISRLPIYSHTHAKKTAMGRGKEGY